jgi:hypothetical protein
MTRWLRIGDRVRLKGTLRRQDYSTGDTGTVLGVMLTSTRTEEVVYQVRIDGDDATLCPVFYADELELVE